jgi:hypothetical protein
MKRMWIYAFLGGLAFWTPDIAAKAIGAVSPREDKGTEDKGTGR